jgi:uncharacterized protein (DUF924 family)
MTTPQDILSFWFAPGQDARWFAQDAQFDAGVRRRFFATYELARAGKLDAWRDTPQSLLALIIVLDQFSRNMFRGTAQAFDMDEKARALTLEGIEKGFPAHLRGAELDFFYMPLLHSERLSDHDLLAAQGRGEDKYARHYRDVIARFGRFPRRNRALGRVSTPEELAYLAASDPLG